MTTNELYHLLSGAPVNVTVSPTDTVDAIHAAEDYMRQHGYEYKGMTGTAKGMVARFEKAADMQESK
jgi:hypothetical protein